MMSSYPSELRRYSSKRGVAGLSPGADTEFRLRKTSYTCASFKSLRPGPCKTDQHVVVLGLDLSKNLRRADIPRLHHARRGGHGKNKTTYFFISYYFL